MQKRLLLQNSCCSEEVKQHEAIWTLARGAASEDLRALSAFHCSKELQHVGGGSLAFACKKGQREMAIEPDYPHEAQRSGEFQKLPA